jgi:hypothetical protein
LRLELAHRDISGRRRNSVTFGAKRTFAIGTATRKPSFQNQFTLLAYVYAYGVCSMAATDQVREHRRRAQECVDIATMICDPAHRLLILEMARTWMHLAEKAEKERADMVWAN